MIWRRVAIMLLGVLVAGCAWMYLRDRPDSARQRSVRAQAQYDAEEMLAMLASSSRTCADRCRADVLDRPAPGVWRVRLQSPSWRQCFLITVDTFSYSDRHGFNGLHHAPCA